MDIPRVSAIVTGGASGLGRATAEHLAALGAKVTIFDLNTDAGAAVANKIGAAFVPVNVTDEKSVADGIAFAESENGVPRILVNCAGITIGMKTVGKGNEPHVMDQFRKVIEINLLGTYNMISKFAAKLAAAEAIGEERGVIVTTASVAAFEGQVGQAAYAASKAGVAGMTLPVARDLAQHAIRIVSIAPGLFITPMLEGLPQDVQVSLGRQVPFPNRLGQPHEYARLVQSIIENPMLNGETIRLDGAIRMGPR